MTVTGLKAVGTACFVLDENSGPSPMTFIVFKIERMSLTRDVRESCCVIDIALFSLCLQSIYLFQIKM